jgi:tetratricopeptide (TPR) repeat protein
MLEVAYRTLGRSAEAAEFSDRALENYAGSGDLVGEANVLNNRGIQSHFAGRWRQAIRDYERSRVLRRQAGDVVGEALVANNIGEIRCLQNRFDVAHELYEFARSAWEAAGYPVGVAYVMANQAMLAARSGDLVQGFDLLDEAAERMERLGVTSLLLEVQLGRVECHLLGHRPDLALAEAASLVDRLHTDHVGDEQLQLHATVLLGLARLRSGEIDGAASMLPEVMERATGHRDRYIEALCTHTLAELELAQGGAAIGLRERADELLAKLDVVGHPPVLSAG